MKPHGSGTKEKGNRKVSFPQGLVGRPEGFSLPLTLLNPLHTGPLTLEKRTQISR